MVRAQKFILQNYFTGFPQSTDLKLVEEELPEIKDGEFLAEAVYLSVDPYMRIYAERLPLGTTFLGIQVALIKESKNNKFPVGKYILAPFGWRTHTISNGVSQDIPFLLVPDLQGLPISLALGVLGTIGNTAYFGFLELCKPKSGETVVVSGAAGAVGSHVGQIAKIKGCKVIGIAGSDEKGKWLMEELGFDHFINYKSQNVENTLREYAPHGVDCYFDNVGGELSSIILGQMNQFGRIAVCGSISSYNDVSSEATTDSIQFLMFSKQLRMEGFMVSRWYEDRWMEGILQNRKWIQQGKLKYRETITNGFENMFIAFIDMLKGGNSGKALVKV